MNWLELLYTTYENNASKIGHALDSVPLFPICHTSQNAQIEVTLSADGKLQSASVITAKEDMATIVPATEDSAGRSGTQPPPHPLFDKLKYVAGDLGEYLPADSYKPKDHENYLALLEAWSRDFSEPKLRIVLAYIRQKRLIKDLVAVKVLELDERTKLLRALGKGESSDFDVFKVLQEDAGEKRKLQQSAFVRFAVSVPGDSESQLWKSKRIWDGWIQYYTKCIADRGLCYVTGREQTLATSHPSKLRHAADKAKLISSNDTSGFTYRGRLETAAQVCGVSYEVSQKAHSALRWLIGRQGAREGSMVFVAWAVSGVAVPNPWAELLALDEEPASERVEGTAQGVGKQVAQLIRGYRTTLTADDRVVVLGLDAATPGRMAIRYFRTLLASEFLDRVLAWHTLCEWPQEIGKGRTVTGAPSPRDIAFVSQGSNADEAIRRAVMERITPCIIDAAPVPRDLTIACVRRATARHSMKHWEWNRALGVACALFKGSHPERGYTVALDLERKTRDYLFGRLLAVADGLESAALRKANEDRPTNAARLMHQFSVKPRSTWKTIELALGPYRARLGKRSWWFDMAIQNIMTLFDADDFSDSSLDGEFLLGFHCQRADLWRKKEDKEPSDDSSADPEGAAAEATA